MIAILVAPKFDDATSYSFDWSREVKRMLEEKGYAVIDISGREVSREEVEKALKDNPGAIYIHYNHGEEDAHFGSLTEKVVDLKNVQLLGKREVYCLNCLSAKKLGVEAYRNGAIAYWGYIKTFIFSTDAINEFKTFANVGIKLRLEGKTWEECLQTAKNLAKELCQKLISEGKIISAVILQHDADALRCYTENNPPESQCLARKIAIKLLGPKIGWKIGGKHAIGWILYLIGYGVALHDFAHQVWLLKGTVISLEGGYIGFALCFVGFIFLTLDYVEWLR